MSQVLRGGVGKLDAELIAAQIREAEANEKQTAEASERARAAASEAINPRAAAHATMTEKIEALEATSTENSEYGSRLLAAREAEHRYIELKKIDDEAARASRLAAEAHKAAADNLAVLKIREQQSRFAGLVDKYNKAAEQYADVLSEMMGVRLSMEEALRTWPRFAGNWGCDLDIDVAGIVAAAGGPFDTAHTMSVLDYVHRVPVLYRRSGDASKGATPDEIARRTFYDGQAMRKARFGESGFIPPHSPAIRASEDQNAERLVKGQERHFAPGNRDAGGIGPELPPAPREFAVN